MDAAPDSGLDALLPLDGEVFFIDPQGNHRVKFEVKRVAASAERPHGLRYSLTLHARDGERLVGLTTPIRLRPARDRGEEIGGVRSQAPAATIRPYEYSDAASLLEDFWHEVEAALAERGVNL